MAEHPFTIAFTAGVTLTRWTGAWQQRRPDVPLAFVPTTAADQVEVLVDGRADVAFVRLPVEVEGLSIIPLYDEIAVVVAPKDHPIAAFEDVTLADLAGEERVSEVLSPADAVELVAAGGGIVILPHALARQYARKDLVSRPVADAPQTGIAIAWAAHNTTDLVEEFVGIVRGRTANSSRDQAAPPKQKATAKAKAAAKEKRAAVRGTPKKKRR